MNVYKTLLIVGNGFDLQCGLKSGYEDFIKWLNQSSAEEKHNLWAEYFLERYHQRTLEGMDWVNVESCLQEALENERNGIKHWLSTAFSEVRGSWEGSPFINVLRYLKQNYKRDQRNFLVNGTKVKPLDYHWFLEELHKFERQFSEYLQAVIENSTDYVPNAIKLMKLLEIDNYVMIINFNYTNPFMKFPCDGNLMQFINVHGIYKDDSIIFGIDDAIMKMPINTHIFTKTYRKMLQGNQENVLPEGIETIKFYGHSLGKADYSYFQSIFDRYNLYDFSSVNLQFFYTIHDKNKKAQIEREAMDSVYKLITVYGDTIDNKDKGKNLLHKLLLEGRIIVTFLDNINKKCGTANSVVAPLQLS